MSSGLRADKWLWATRFFKNRSLAASVCSEGKVTRNGHILKPASAVQPGDILEIPFSEGPGRRTIRVIAIIERRVGAPEAQACYDEQTPAQVFDTLKQWQEARQEAPKGRPTKRDRRKLDQIHGFRDGL